MLTAKSQKDATDLLTGNVPTTWQTKWEGPENPTMWIRLVTKKAVALLSWTQRMQSKTLLAQPVNLSDLFHPETFLNALRQKSARALKIAIDELKLVSTFEHGKIGNGLAIQLEGLWLQGSAFDGKRLSDIKESNSSSELVNLPPCFVAWTGRSDADIYPVNQIAETPVYHTLDREKLLCTLMVPNNGEASIRTISGAAIFLQGSD